MRVKGRRARRVWLVIALLLAGLGLGACALLQHPRFGAVPEGDRLAAIAASPNYVDGEFRNLVPTPVFTDGASFVSVVLGSLVAPAERRVPHTPVPVVRTDLVRLDPARDLVVWLGHGSYFVQLGGKRILVDPVLSAAASPVPGGNAAFEGTTLYTADDIPPIDVVLISHDHWDHLDYPTLTALQSKVARVVCGLGVGATLELWGYPKEKIHEADWFTALELEPGFVIHVLPARHYSGRLLTRNRTLWAGYALQTSQRRLFFSGDGGYGPHFDEIGRRFGGFDIVVLDSGQYDRRWAHIHMTPEEAVQAAEVLGAKALLPAHVGRFALAGHAWDDPFKRVVAASVGKRFRLLTPRIGEPVELASSQQRFTRWWEAMD